MRKWGLVEWAVAFIVAFFAFFLVSYIVRNAHGLDSGLSGKTREAFAAMR
jgi:hypothetical protein